MADSTKKKVRQMLNPLFHQSDHEKLSDSTKEQEKSQKKERSEEELLGAVVTNLEKVNARFKWYRLALRAFITGILTSLGATIGFALLIFLLTQVYDGLRDLPLVGDWFEDIEIVDQINESVPVSDE